MLAASLIVVALMWLVISISIDLMCSLSRSYLRSFALECGRPHFRSRSWHHGVHRKALVGLVSNGYCVCVSRFSPNLMPYGATKACFLPRIP